MTYNIQTQSIPPSAISQNQYQRSLVGRVNSSIYKNRQGINVDVFAQYACTYAPGYGCSAKKLFEAYKQFCIDHMLQYTNSYMGFCAAFKYHIMGRALIYDIYTSKVSGADGLVYYNLYVNYKPIPRNITTAF